MDSPLDKVLVSTPPPPPLEVKIRTMRSDIESMRKSGGGAPAFRNVAVKGLLMEKEYHPAEVSRAPMPSPASAPARNSAPAIGEDLTVPNRVPPPPSHAAPATAIAPEPVAPQEEPPSGSENHLTPILIVVLVAVLALGIVGYFAYTLFIK